MLLSNFVFDLANLPNVAFVPVVGGGDYVIIVRANGAGPGAALVSSVVANAAGGGGGGSVSAASINAALGFVPYNASNPLGFQTGTQLAAALGPYALTTALLSSLPGPATAVVAGLVKVGTGLNVVADGTVSAASFSITANAGAPVPGTPLVTNDGTTFTAAQILALGATAPVAPLPRIITAAGPVTILASDGLVKIVKTGGAPTTVTMEATPAAGATHTIKDGKGDAAVNPITISSASGTIDGAATFVINTNREAVTLQYDSIEWSVI